MRKHKFWSILMLAVIILSLLSSCGNSSNFTIFDIGDSREKVIKTVISDFKVMGEKLDKEGVLDNERGNHITMYDCEYNGQKYSKVRVYYSDEKVRRIELSIEKGQIDIEGIIDKLESRFGTPHHTRLPYMLGNTINATVFMGKVEAVVLVEWDEYYDILVVSGEQRDELNREM